MNVLFHTDALAKKDQYGLARYAKCLLQEPAFLEAVQPAFFALLSDAPNVLPQALDFAVDKKSVHLPRLHPRLCQLLWAAGAGPNMVGDLSSMDLVHTLELDYPVSVRKKPWIATIHDIGPLTHRDYFSKSRPKLRHLGLVKAAKAAQRIICVSHATANEVQTYLDRDLGDQLAVVHEGVEEEYFLPPDMSVLDSLPDMPGENQPFIFWAGTVNPRKNIDGLLKAFMALEGKIDHHLVIAGNVGWDAEELVDLIRRDSRLKSRVHLLGFVSDEQLRALYRRASMFAYISRMEGFGLPILEAMACGCPVITSNVSSMPEVAGDAALLVDPDDEESISAAIERVINDDALSQSLKARGLDRARQMSWGECAEGVLQVYRAVLSGSSSDE